MAFAIDIYGFKQFSNNARVSQDINIKGIQKVSEPNLVLLSILSIQKVAF